MEKVSKKTTTDPIEAIEKKITYILDDSEIEKDQYTKPSKKKK